MTLKATMCEQRDGYFGKWLSHEERVQFETHVAHCLDCKQAVQEQQRLDDLLARANVALLPVPAILIDQIDQRLRLAGRRRLAGWKTALAAAGILIGILAGWLLPQREPNKEPRRSPVVALPSRQPEPASDPRSLVQVTFQPSSDVIAVPQKTENPSVTIIWVYPTIKTVQESAPAPADSF